MNSDNSKVIESCRLLLDISEKIKLKGSDKYVCCFIKFQYILYVEYMKKVILKQ